MSFAGPESQALPVSARSLLRISAPIALSTALTLVLGLNDTIILGRSGAAVVAAGAVAISAFTVLLGTVLGLAVPAQVLTAQRLGGGDPEGAARAATTTAAQALGAAAVLAGLLALLAGPLTRAILGSGPIAALSADYLRVLAPALVLQALSASLRGFVTGLGRTRIVLTATAVSVVVDVVLAYAALALGLGPLGVAASTVLGIAAAAVVLVLSCRRLSAYHPVPRPARLRSARMDLPAVRRIAVPEALQLTFGFGAGLVVSILVAPEGPAALAAVRALDNLLMVLYVLAIGASSGVVTLAAQRFGAGDLPGVREAERAGWRLLMPTILVIAIMGALLTQPLVALMVDDSRVAALAGDVAILAWAQAPLLGLGLLGNAVNRAYGDSRIGLVASIVAEYAIFLPIGLIALRFLDSGIAGIMVAHLAYWAAFIAMIAPRRRRRLAEAIT